MRKTWALRGIRLWFVLFVPIFIWLGYIYLHAAIQLAEWRLEHNTWISAEQQRATQGLRSPLTETEIRFHRLLHDDYFAEKERDLSLTFLFIALSLPGVALVFSKLGAWVWSPSLHACRDSASPPTQIDKVFSLHMRAYFVFVAGVAFLAVGLYFSPEKALRAGISGAIQVLGMSLVAWLIVRLRRKRNLSPKSAA